MGGDLYDQLIVKRQREIELHRRPDGLHVSWLPKLARELGDVVRTGERLALPHSDHTDAHNYRNALLNLAATALAAMPNAKAV